MVLGHTFYQFLLHVWTHGPGGTAARLSGLDPVRLWGSADLILVAADPDLDPAANDDLSPGVCHAGVVLPELGTRARRSGTRPRVLVSLSTWFFPQQEHMLQTIIEALDGLGMDAVVTTGPAVDPARLRAGPRGAAAMLPASASAGQIAASAGQLLKAGLQAAAARIGAALRATNGAVEAARQISGVLTGDDSRDKA